MIFHHLEVSTEASASVRELTGFQSALYQQLELTPTKNADLKLQQLHRSKRWKSGCSYGNDLLYLPSV